MKILHTADWHIGKKLHKYDLLEDFYLFVDWLVEFIEAEKIEVILISGDVFDLANPSNEAKKAYYQSLVQLQKTGVKIIITGGNHDSPSFLNAPDKLLQELGISVVGGVPKNTSDLLIPVYNTKNEIELVVAAVPYLRNNTIQEEEIAKTFDERVTNLRNGIQKYYEEVAILAKKDFPDIPCIAMGHLFAKGVSTSESERDIQLGNLASVEASQFGTYFVYVALGHIHQPQQVKGNIPIYYSGSPLSLSFSEKKDKKRVLVIDTKKSFTPESIEVPVFRKLISISGNLQELKLTLESLESNEQLTNLIEVEVIETTYNPELSFQVSELIDAFNNQGFEIVKHRIRFTEQAKKMGDLTSENTQLNELKIQEVFQKKLNEINITEEKKELLQLALTELYEELIDKDQ